MSYSGVVLTGGSSQRMGTDKALLRVHGDPLALVAARALQAAGAAEVLAIGGDLVALSALGLDVRPDRWPGAGPLGGLVTGLQAASQPRTVVLACDLPFVDASLVLEVLAGLDDPRTDVTVPVVDGRRQPVAAAYRTTAVLHLQAAFDAGVRSLHQAFDGLTVCEMHLTGVDRLVDLDEPDDLRALDGR